MSFCTTIAENSDWQEKHQAFLSRWTRVTNTMGFGRTMLEARRRVLATHNLFAFVDREISGWKGTSATSTSARPTALSPLAGAP